MRKIWPWTYVRVPSFYFLFQSWDKCALWRGFVRRRMNILIVGDQRGGGQGQLRDLCGTIRRKRRDWWWSVRCIGGGSSTLPPHDLTEKGEKLWISWQRGDVVGKWQWAINLHSVEEKRWERRHWWEEMKNIVRHGNQTCFGTFG